MSGIKTKQYPPQMGAYKVFVHEGRGWSAHNTARLDISVGKPNHEGEKFLATCSWAAARFEVIHVEVADTLQRYNLMADGIPEDKAKAMCLGAGNEWLQRNAEALSLLSNHVVHRWDQWLSDPRFASTHEQIRVLYKAHEGFRGDIDRTAAGFLGRQEAMTQECWDSHLSHSIAFLLEEAAIFAIQQQTTPAVDVYPGTFMKIFDRFKREAIPGAPAGLDQRLFTRIDFLRQRNEVSGQTDQLYKMTG